MRFLILAFALCTSLTSLHACASHEFSSQSKKLFAEENWMELITLGKQVLSDKKVPTEEKAHLHADLAAAHFYIGDYTTGETHALAALELSDKIPSKVPLVRSLYLLSAHKRGLGNTQDIRYHAEAQSYIQKALSQLDEETPIQLKGKTYFNAGAAYTDPDNELRDLDLAIDFYLKAIACFQEAQDLDSSDRTSIRLSKAYLLNGDVDTAWEISEGMNEAHCTKKTLTHLLYLKAQIAIEEARLPEAREYVEKALKLSDQLGLKVDHQRLLNLQDEYSL